jgi:PHS family inorganic phosphate transporter-like MFS transporter
MMATTFSSQGYGQLAAALVALASLAAFKKQIINDPAGYAHHLDFVWRLVIGLGAVPGALALYFRLTLPETPRFTMDVERNIKQASSDVDAFLQTGGYVTDQTPAIAGPIAAPKATWRDFGRYFRKYENFKLLFGTAFTWFALDVAFYGLGLNSSLILSAIGYGSPSSGTPSEKRYYSLHNNAVGNIIITIAGLLPGFWLSIGLIDVWGRRVSTSCWDISLPC